MSNKAVKSSSSPLKGEISVPGDKSISHRAIMLSSIADGRSSIKNFLRAEDCMSTLNAMKSAGVSIEMDGDLIIVHGAGLRGLKEPEDLIDAGNSGTTTRLLAGLFAGQDFFTVLTGDRYLRKRPMKRVVHPLRLMGADISGREGGDKLPIALNGKILSGIEYHSPIASAQVKSSILLAGLYAEGRTEIIEPSLSRDHTERMLLSMGAKGAKRESSDRTAFSIEGGGALSAIDVEVPGDISSAAFFIVAALIVHGSEIKINGMGINPTRTGILDILINMGGDISLENKRDVEGEPVADILVRSSRLKGVEIKGELIPRAIDEIPVIAVAASVAEGKTVIRDARELRVKESDRIESMVRGLTELGVTVEELDDGMTIEGAEEFKGAVVESYGDHRIAMSMAVAGLAARGETLIKDYECVNISFPGFFDLLKTLQD